MDTKITSRIVSQCIVLLLVLAACTPASRKEKTDTILSIIPQPKEVHVYEGSFVLDSSTQLVFSTEEQHKAANWFNDELQNRVGWSSRIGKSQEEKNSIVLIQEDSLADEAYLLDITDDRIAIKAASEPGYFYAFQTLLQLFPVSKEKIIRSELKFDQLSIADRPLFKWRGAMLDISRHFFGPETIRQLIDQWPCRK